MRLPFVYSAAAANSSVMNFETLEAPAPFSTRVAARILALSPSRIRYWVRRRLVSPVRGQGRRLRFSFAQLALMRRAKELLARRRRLEPLLPCLAQNSETGRSAAPARWLVSRDGRLLVRRADAWLEPESGQLVFAFDLGLVPRAEPSLQPVLAEARLQKRFEEARRAAANDEGRSRNPGPLDGVEAQTYGRWLERADAALRNGDLPAAKRCLVEAAAAAPLMPEAHLRLGRLERALGKPGKAAQSFQRALRCAPLLAEAHRELAAVYEQMGRREDAARHRELFARPADKV